MRSTDPFGDDSEPGSDSPPIENDFVQDGETICIIPRTDFSFDGRVGTLETGVLALGVDASEWSSALFMLLVHARSDWVAAEGTSASWQVEVHNASLDPTAPELEFIEGDNVAISSRIVWSTAIPYYRAFQLTAPFGPQLRVRWIFSQGLTAATSALSLSASVYLVGRRGR